MERDVLCREKKGSIYLVLFLAEGVVRTAIG